MHDELHQFLPEPLPVLPGLGVALELGLLLRGPPGVLLPVELLAHAHAPRLLTVLRKTKYNTCEWDKGRVNLLQNGPQYKGPLVQQDCQVTRYSGSFWRIGYNSNSYNLKSPFI